MQVKLFNKILSVGTVMLILGGVVTPTWADSNELNVISEVSGDVALKRAEWQDFKKVSIGDLLKSADQLKLGNGAKATVLCNNLKVWKVPIGKVVKVSEGCGTNGVLTVMKSSELLIRSRDTTKLYIIMPRNTQVLTNRPLLRWHGLPDTASYTVSITSEDVNFGWQMETPNPQVQYPGNPPLKADLTYFVTVVAGKPQDDLMERTITNPTASFSLLNRETAALVAQQVEQIKAQKFSPEAEIISLAYLYLSYDLKSEAIQLLETFIESNNQSRVAYRLLGEIYQTLGLNNEAQIALTSALQLAQKVQDIPIQAEVQFRLGQLQVAANNLPAAVDPMQQARQYYQQLGDRGKVEEIDTILKELPPRS